eukprot:CAMPEP_0114364344 /NCGR_PEP_ID=MMETSP0101-20121206/27412_1 /TAXON_ID=38822 ORGANISM="Pteridomonas danica, Strain PT" /NCGR_SAMPLE_ID=MMETSP0101 /ASSEMBLY_ACC=CAM_ASM_000211 /LENGTH=60 /DNA_ID=CAMNT_0001511771 /DNA_START=1 /DNA_END=179 /DNA_ORIENTATION=+
MSYDLQNKLKRMFPQELSHCQYADLVLQTFKGDLLPNPCDLRSFHNSESSPFLITAPHAP